MISRSDKLRWLPLIILSSMLFATLPSHAAPSASDSWSSNDVECSDFKMPGFKARGRDFSKLVKEGKLWDSDVSQELIAIQHVSTETCKKWAADPNGDQILAQFTSEFAKISLSALHLKQAVEKSLEPKLTRIWMSESTELAPYGMSFAEFPCGKAFLRTQKNLAEKLKSIENSFVVLKKACPAAADGIIAAASKNRIPAHAAQGDGGPGNQAGQNGESVAPPSDITGTKKAKEDELESQKLIELQK